MLGQNLCNLLWHVGGGELQFPEERHSISADPNILYPDSQENLELEQLFTLLDFGKQFFTLSHQFTLLFTPFWSVNNYKMVEFQ